MAAREYRLGRLTLQAGRQLAAEGTPVPLTRKPLEILTILAEAQGALVTKDELISAVWPNQVIEEGALHVHIAALRKALGAEAERLKTVHGFGYRLDAAQDEPPPAIAAAPPPGSVAVLPFADLTGRDDWEYLADGLAEELIIALSRDPGLKVSSRTASFSYRGRVIDPREVGRQLGVAAVVEGSLRISGDRVRLIIQLVDVVSGFQIWSETLDRDLGNLLDLQNELASAVAASLGRELQQGLPTTRSDEAMRLHLQARFMALRLSGDALVRSVALLRSALTHDPDFAAAHEALAQTLLAGINSGAMLYHARDEARREAECALALDPSLSGARSVIACLDALQGRWEEAERQFTEVLQTTEGDPWLHEAFARFVLLPSGRHRAARAHGERALELAPARPQASYLCGVCAAMRGDLAAMSDHLETAHLLGISEHFRPFRILRATCLSFHGRLEEAGEDIVAALPDIAHAARGAAVTRAVYATFAGKGDSKITSKKVRALFEACRGKDDFWNDLHLVALMGCWQVGLGAMDEAYYIFGTAIERRRHTRHLTTAMLDSLWMPIMAPFRADPRFQPTVDDLGMTDFWSRVGPPDGYALRDGKLIAAEAAQPATASPSAPAPA